MKIMVFNVAAEGGGALSILNEFYDLYEADKNNEYIFVVSKAQLNESNNIKVLRFPWIKKSWFHRLYFDYIVAPTLIKKYNIDEVLSLQNIFIPRTKVKQSVYVHNALPLAEKKFSIKEDKLLWVYQNIIGKKIFKSIKQSNKVIVQTEWMKKKCIEELGTNKDKIKVLPPKVDIKVKTVFNENKINNSTFFYPASSMIFKNHKIIVEACLELKRNNIKDYTVIFTLTGNENKNIRELYKVVKEAKLPIKFIGNISRELVFDYYSKSILIFPSYIETVGLPLLEARMHGTPILASNCSFSREILNGYKNVKYFDPMNHLQLAEIIKSSLDY